MFSMMSIIDFNEGSIILGHQVQSTNISLQKAKTSEPKLSIIFSWNHGRPQEFEKGVEHQGKRCERCGGCRGAEAPALEFILNLP